MQVSRPRPRDFRVVCFGVFETALLQEQITWSGHKTGDVLVGRTGLSTVVAEM